MRRRTTECDSAVLQAYQSALVKGYVARAHAIARGRARFHHGRGELQEAANWGRSVAFALYCLGRYDEALGEVRTSLALQDDPVERALCFLTIGGIHVMRFQLDEARTAIEEAEKISRYYSRQRPDLTAWVRNVRGIAADLAGNPHETVIELMESARLWRELIQPRMAATALNNLASSLNDARQPRMAEEFALTALDLLRNDPDYRVETNLYANLGHTFAATGRYTDAERLLEKAISSFKTVSDFRSEVYAVLDLSEVLSKTRRRKLAREKALEGLRIATRLKLEPLIVRANSLLADIPLHTFQKSRGPFLFHGLVGGGDWMSSTIARLRTIASANEPVLLQGETGTGKELVARAIHLESKRQNGPFIPFNCSALSRDLVESRLFGHRKGAFTGANEDSGGVIRAAQSGTLLLDEIGDLTVEAQGALLRFLQSGEIQPVGAARPVKVDVRVVAATNRDLREDANAGLFRKDLFYRLNVTTLWLPPLRSRTDDIPVLARHFAGQYGKECNLPEPVFSREELAAMREYEWPGNVRELQSYVKRRVLFGEDALYQGIEPCSQDATCDAASFSGLLAPDGETGYPDRRLAQVPPHRELAAQPEPALFASSRPQRSWLQLSEGEKHLRLAEVLADHAGNVTAAARVLGISRRTIQRLRKSGTGQGTMVLQGRNEP